MTLNLISSVMGYAHLVTEMNIWPKFNENPFRGKGDIEQTQNSRVNPLNCDLDRESGQPSHGFCTLSYRDEHLTKVE